MSIRTQYILFILLLHGIIAVLAYYLLKENLWYFYFVQIGMLITLGLSVNLYRKFIKPIALMQSGVDAIKDEDYNVKFLKTGSTDINDLIDVFNAMLEKLRTERVRTQEQAYFLESIIDASPSGMIIMNYDDGIFHINPAARQILGIHRSIQQDDIDVMSFPLLQEILRLPINQSEVVSLDNVHQFKCQVSRVVHRGFQRKFVIIEELSKEFLENEKKAYGKVIRMMAHEVNNSMGAVNSIIQSVIDFGFSDEDADREMIDSLELAKERNTDLARFMKNFASVVRLPQPTLRAVNIKELVKNTVELMKPLGSERSVDIDLSFPVESIEVNCDEDQIRQVMINIIKNACESIGQNGHVTIALSRNRPQIIVSDDGAGISPSAQKNIFTPFFSTKPTGQGIGLMITREILLQHNAQFRLYTVEETGKTHFEISF